MRSKWQILQARTDALMSQLADLTSQLDWMERTPFKANGTGRCSACGTELPTEADFAKHYLVEDERFLNLGYCPNPKLLRSS
jgi:hypothetical protein